MSSSVNPVPGRGTRYLALGSLVLMGVLWGSTFFSMKDLTGRLPVPDLLAVRFLIAAVTLGLVFWRHWRMSRRTLLHGTILGLIYGTAQLVQTVGLAHTAASVSGFVTGLYVVITPFLAAWLLRERIALLTWLAVMLAALGLGVLTLDLSSGVAIGFGESLTLASAVIYACHIVAVDRWSEGDDAIALTMVTLAVVALECGLAALPGGIQLPSGRTDWLWMLYIAVIAGAIPIFLQVWAQAVVESTTAAVLMAGEPVWAAVFAVLLGGERLTWQMLAGGGSMFAAMILVTILPKLRSRQRARG
ncbi:DMT family transporter [Luteococcus sp. H138]|uniref:DMT family transporter n=1 Tax=unclassified Luteococcus TaxID=2639923 RepID=UPI00313BB8E5